VCCAVLGLTVPTPRCPCKQCHFQTTNLMHLQISLYRSWCCKELKKFTRSRMVHFYFILFSLGVAVLFSMSLA